jgi:TatD DNase family protein
MLQFINIHTHQPDSKEFSLINLFPESVSEISEDRFYSIGIHPWEITKINATEQLKIVAETIKLINVPALGEIGLDKLHPAFETQKELFLKQLDIAEKMKKPVIIHCVKACSELLEILKKRQPKVPLIIHRYSGNKTTAEQLLKFGCFLSFGHELFNTGSKTPKVFIKIPIENIFLETDDADIDIETVYRKAAELKKMAQEDLSRRIFLNFNRCFPYLKDKFKNE